MVPSSWVNVGAIWVIEIVIEVVDLRLLFFDLPPLFFSLPSLLVQAGVFFLLIQLAPTFLFLPVLFKLVVPGGDFDVVYAGPHVLHALRGLFHGGRVVPYVSLDHGLPVEVPLSVLEVGTYQLGWVLKNAWHLLQE